MKPEAMFKAHARVLEQVMDLAAYQSFGSQPDLEMWLPPGLWRKDGTRLGSIAQDAGGSLFLTWRYPGLTGPDPVVFLGDGIHGVVAPDLQTFIHALGSGFSCSGGTWETGGWDEDEDLALRPFQKAVARAWGVLSAKPRILAQEAAQAHPDFARWVQGLWAPEPKVVLVPVEPLPAVPEKDRAFVPPTLDDEEASGPQAEAKIGLQLWREGKWAEAFGHLETAVMSLSAKDPLTKQAFEALDDLEKRGFVGT